MTAQEAHHTGAAGPRGVADLLRAAIDRSGALRSVIKSAPAQRVIEASRAATIIAPAPRFLARHAGPPAAGTYRLRSTGAAVRLRTRTRDAAVLNEIFGSRPVYAPPEHMPAFDGPISVLDLGGNIGLFGLYALQRWDVATMRSYEPDVDNYRLLTETAAQRPGWEAVPVAVGNAPGSLRFRSGLFSDSRAALEGEDGVDVPVVDLFADSDGCDLLKIDIEGGEWPILADPRLAGFARVIVLEWHFFGAPSLPAEAAASELLTRAGYVNQWRAPDATHACGILWAWA
jgi:FkbM family methyltransferase